MTRLSKGYVQVYTGDGKGKTTAALGLAVRAAGAGLKVFIAQFVKGMAYAEHESLKKLSDNITIRQYGRDCFIVNKPEQEDIDMARAGLQEVEDKIESGAYDLVILDEANIATYFNLFKVDDLLRLIDNKPEHVELVITGRKAEPRLLERADLITEMQEIKHYYNNGVAARGGIEM
jgi:cob(I)alamin adenosyltransferase